MGREGEGRQQSISKANVKVQEVQIRYRYRMRSIRTCPECNRLDRDLAYLRYYLSKLFRAQRYSGTEERGKVLKAK